MHGIAFFECFCKFKFYKPKLRPYVSTKLVKTQSHPTRAYRTKYHGTKRFRKKQRDKNEGAMGEEPPRADNGGHRGPWQPFLPQLQGFFTAV